MHVSDAIIGLLLSLIFCNCENDLSSVDTTAFIASRISIDLSPSNVTNLNETEPTLNNTDTSNWIEIVATTATSTENVTTTSTTTVIITSTSARINETAHSKTPSVMNTTSTPPQNTVKPTTPSAKPNLGLILGLSLGLGLPFLIASVNGSIDDKYFTITIPFNITLYNTTTTSVTITINGVICLRSCSTTFIETAFPTSAFSDATILTYWNDLYIYANASQGIYYKKQGNTPKRNFITEYHCSHYQQSTDYYNFQVIFFENMPGVVQFIYYEVIDEGASATVDVQGNEAKQ
ncbi:unnamed protein product [Rotaria sordida]|uniref:Uncharacterized protein n=1 Tax=Rotaria sordida TaxID=392033 RepID=A0A814MPK1_9BILA|nr:unnamed protein product [Rotaria sordida]CAF1286578.1 unnamed protein product [Rotaria sordida]